MGKRSYFARRPMDDYATPFEAVPPLIPHLRNERIETYAEPCCGNGDLIRHLESFGGLFCVHHDDLKFGTDALACGSHVFAGADAIITNPPWTRELLHPLIRHFQRIAPTWLLFDADWAHTKQSAPFIGRCSHIVSVGRVRWMPGTKHDGKDNAAWYRFDSRHSGGPLFVGRASNEGEKINTAGAA
jgi:hypothetical protein